MGKSYNYQLCECLCNNKKAELNALMASPQFVAANMDDSLYVELIQLRWDAETVMKFAKLASDDQLATLIATAILQAHAVKLGPLFELMKDSAATIKKHQLSALFLVSCDHEDAEGVGVLVQHKCFDPQDTRPVLAVLRKQASRNAPILELVTTVLDAHPGHKEAALYARENWIATAKNPETREKLTKIVEAYLAL